VIKIEGSGFSYLTFGKPDDLKIGDCVLSIGYQNSGEIGKVVDTGIDHIGLFQTENFIKTTAFIVLGDSGGPLLNDKGDVVGINAAALVDKEGKYFRESLAISSKLAPKR
jgi:S1-C subfamily serine protease